jgi:hypothetical protein
VQNLEVQAMKTLRLLQKKLRPLWIEIVIKLSCRNWSGYLIDGVSIEMPIFQGFFS